MQVQLLPCLPVVPQDNIEERMGLDLIVLIRKIFLGFFHCLELIYQPLDLIHPKHCHNLSNHYHHEVSSRPLHHCLDVAIIMGGYVQSSIRDSKP